LRRAIDDLSVHDTGGDLRAALSLAAAIAAGRSESRIDLITDGACAPASDTQFGDARVAVHLVGRGRDNVGITAMDCRRQPGGSRALQATAVTHNYGAGPRTFTQTLTVAGELVDAREVRLGPGADDTHVFDVPEPTAEAAAEVGIDVDDDLAVDNRVVAVVRPRRPIRVLLMTAGNPFLAAALNVDPDTQVSTARPGAVPKGDYDVTVFDGAAPASAPPGSYLYAGCVGDRCPAAPAGTASGVGVVDCDRTHPALRYADFGSTQWRSAMLGKPADWARELAASTRGPIIVAGEQEGRRSLWTGFGLGGGASSFPLTVAYPIFVGEVVRWLANADDTSGQLRTGSAVTLRNGRASGALSVLSPDGSAHAVTSAPGAAPVYTETDHAGRYAVRGPGGYRTSFACNLADPLESDIRPRGAPVAASSGSGQGGRQVTTLSDLWPWFVVVAILVLCAEWWFFHRRAFVT
jgi:hypothetical protein